MVPGEVGSGIVGGFRAYLQSVGTGFKVRTSGSCQSFHARSHPFSHCVGAFVGWPSCQGHYLTRSVERDSIADFDHSCEYLFTWSVYILPVRHILNRLA